MPKSHAVAIVKCDKKNPIGFTIKTKSSSLIFFPMDVPFFLPINIIMCISCCVRKQKNFYEMIHHFKSTVKETKTKTRSRSRIPNDLSYIYEILFD